MCGIVGAITLSDGAFRIADAYITRMRDTMVHRGPDDAGHWISPDKRVGLGHRRLSIIDLTASAKQPMSNNDGSLQLVFNGEIYNHGDIRRELEQLGHHSWRTDHSDTEVILHAYEQWGLESVERLRGMFAFGLWDSRKRHLWLVRDRLGIKPLYYSLHHGRLTFASEIKALLADPDQPRAVDEVAMFHYLSFLASPAPNTMFEGVKKLPAATWMLVSTDGTTLEHRYWDMFDAPRTHTQDEGQIAERILAELRTSVRIHKVSDVPIGVFLSGGIDSSTNAALFSEGEDRPIRTFTIGYDANYSTYPNETVEAQLAARHVGAEYHERLLRARDLIDFLPQMVHLQDEPISDPVCVPLFYLAKLARDSGVTVCQVGEGADELFAGYPMWRSNLRLQLADDLPVPRVLKQRSLALFRRLGIDGTQKFEWLRRAADGHPIFWGGAEGVTDTIKRRLLSARLRGRFDGYTSWEALAPIRRRFEQKAPNPSWHLDWMSYLDLTFRLPELLLMRVDKMAMGVSLEARVPFLDHKFVELAMSIPAPLKLKGGVLKRILKRAVRGVIPDQIIDRPKQGFGVPIHEWFMQSLGDHAYAELEQLCRETDLFDRSYVRRLAEERRNSSALWYLLNFALWRKRYLV